MGLVINKVVSDGLDVLSETAGNMFSSNVIVESVTGVDSLQAEIDLVALVEETFDLDDSLTIRAVMGAALEEVFDLLPDFSFEESIVVVLALDTEQLEPSVHSMPDFNSFAQIGDDVYAAGSAGIYKLTGEDDNGEEITAGVAWEKVNFGKMNRKRIRAVFLEGEIEGTQLQAATESGEETYTVSRNRVSVGRNLIGRDWSLRLSGFDRLEATELSFVVRRR